MSIYKASAFQQIIGEAENQSRVGKSKLTDYEKDFFYYCRMYDHCSRNVQ